MIKTIFALASEFETQLEQIKIAAPASKEKVNRKRLAKKLEKAKADYSQLKKQLDILEADDGKLKTRLDQTRSGSQKARKDIMRMHEAMRKMDLSGANDAMFYADDEDISFVIDNKEMYLDIDDMGEIKATPMNKYRKSKKAPKKDEGCVDEHCTDDSHAHFGPGEKEVKIEEQAADSANADTAEFDDLYASLLK